MGNPLQGAGYFIQGLRLIFKPGIRRFSLIPLVINIVLFSGLITLGYQEFGNLVDWLISFLPDWLTWLRLLIWPIFALTVALVVFFSFSMIANLVGAPFNGPLAAAVERYLDNGSLQEKSPPGSLIKDSAAAILNELHKIGYFLLRAIPLWILFLIPGLNLVAPILWLFFSAWLLCQEYADYPMGNHDLSFSAQRRRLRQRRMASLGFGFATMLANMTPIFNFIVMPVAVAGATVLWKEQLKEVVSTRD
jgi:CysZ protein